MAKPLVLSLDGQEFPVRLTKIDREKLYGTVEIEAFDDKGNPVALRVLAYDGKTVIDKGGTALATVNESGNSISRKDLVPVNSDGEELEPVPSSFSVTNELETASIDEYLSLSVKSVYSLDSEDGSELDLLKDVLSDGRIYKFPFSYRGGIEYDAACLLENHGDIFMVVGVPSSLQYLKLGQAAVLDTVEEQAVSEEDLDFDLL